MKVLVITGVLLLFIVAGSSNIHLQSPGPARTFIQADTIPAPVKQDKKGGPKTLPKETDSLVIADSITIAEGLELIGSDDCTTCHKFSEKSIGPSYKDIAAKYKPTQANIDLLAKRTITGGSARVWGRVPMTPHPDLSMGSAKKMMQFIFSLK